mmetsp:Transcript_7959/g.15972  ORF Transcript_7959/g.15972 Transcript_7959/m.15972 type:complete len:229 (+) Transcript_7959:1537-2223(+)
MMPILINLTQDIKQEWIHIIIQRLVVQKQLGQQAQILTVHLCLLPIYFKHGYLRIRIRPSKRRPCPRRRPINLIPRRTLERALCHVPQQRLLLPEILQRILTYIQLLTRRMRLWIRRKIPRINLMPPKLNHLNILHLGLLLMLLLQVLIQRRQLLHRRTQMINLSILSLLSTCHLLILHARILQPRRRPPRTHPRKTLRHRHNIRRCNPLIQSLIQLIVMNIVHNTVL